MMIKIFKKFNEPVKRVEWYKNGQKKIEHWLLNGESHRENGPSYQDWYNNGQKWTERWFLNGKQHREDGPADKWWNSNGQKEYERWWLNDKRYFTREKWVEELGKIGSSHYEEQQMLLNMEKYNL